MNSLSNRFRDPELIKKIVNSILRLADRPVNIMEVCGTHTMAIAQYGIRGLLPPSIKLISGPGCPVCVTPAETIDEIIEISRIPNTIIASFGDMIRVPGSRTTLEKARSEGSEVRIIYSPLELLDLAEANPKKNIVFTGVGFETTSPLAAAVVIRAKNKNIKNLFILPAFKTVPPALRLIAEHSSSRVNAFLLPGHVSVIIGSHPYEFLSGKFGLSGVISGFEPVDILYSIYLILKQIKTGHPKIKIQYSRTIKPEGNTKAQKLLEEVFEQSPSNWRAIGTIPGSGLIFNKYYDDFSARSKFNIKIIKKKEPKNCLCGKILMGFKIPEECPLFGKLCTPQKAVGPCMVSSEGACAAYYKYGYEILS